MSENSEKKGTTDERQIQYHVDPELDYVYRDVFNIYVGSGDVVMEMGNVHRSMPGHISIKNRIVMTMAGAYKLNQTLEKVLQAAQEKLQSEINS